MQLNEYGNYNDTLIKRFLALYMTKVFMFPFSLMYKYILCIQEYIAAVFSVLLSICYLVTMCIISHGKSRSITALVLILCHIYVFSILPPCLRFIKRC